MEYLLVLGVLSLVYSTFPRASASGLPCPSGTSFMLTVTADDSMTLYIDGREIPDLSHKEHHHTPDTVEIPCDTKVIAVHGRNQGYLRAGILASSDGDYILTDSSWKCSNVSYSGWQNVSYNDSFWQAAIDCGPNRGCSRPVKESYYGSVPSISDKARWIWLRQWNGDVDSNHKEMDMEVFCRKTLNSNETKANTSATSSTNLPKQPFKLSITADDSVFLYIDGIEVANLPNGNCFNTPDAVDVPRDAKVIAVHAKRFRGSQGGILASSDEDYVLTNSSWKCSDVFYYNWEAIDYNDSNWRSAYDFGSNRKAGIRHNGLFYPGISSIDRKAQWIWLRRSNVWRNSTHEEMVDEVFCRKTLSTEGLRNCRNACKEVEQSKHVISLPVSREYHSTTFLTCLGILFGFSVVVNVVLVLALCFLYRKQKSAAQRHRSWNESLCDKFTDGENSQQDGNVAYQTISFKQCQDDENR